MRHPDPTHWYALKDAVKARCWRLCEYCLLRPGDQLHHRHYRTWGRERPEDVMLVCDPCHRLLSGKAPFGSELLVAPGSLADRGDDGRTDTPLWRGWLRSARGFTAKWMRLRASGNVTTEAS